MNSRKLVFLFFTTLLIGGLSSIVVGFAVRWAEYAALFQKVAIGEILSIALWLLGVGFIFSLISQMGFFSYLTVHRFGLGIFKSSSLWNAVQVVIIMFVFFDFIYLRRVLFGDEVSSLVPFILPAVLLLLFSLGIAYIKMKQTNRGAFVPAVFFMFVVSIIEWFPALRANETNWLLLMILPLLACNSWQLLMLHKLVNEQQEKS